LTRLICKNKLEWSSGANQAFQDLKTAFTTVPILIHPNIIKPFFLKSDAFDYALKAVLLQNGEIEQPHHVAFHSQKFTAIEINYEIHNKKLLAIIDSFQE
jgi:DNA-binding transcriptional regulator WhiA